MAFQLRSAMKPLNLFYNTVRVHSKTLLNNRRTMFLTFSNRTQTKKLRKQLAKLQADAMFASRNGFLFAKAQRSRAEADKNRVGRKVNEFEGEKAKKLSSRQVVVLRSFNLSAACRSFL